MKKQSISSTMYQSVKTKKDWNEVKPHVDIFLTYLKELVETNCKKISTKGAILNGFKRSLNEQEIKTYIKCNLKLASESLDRVVHDISVNGLNDTSRNYLLDFVADLKKFVMAVDPSHDYDWMLGNTNTHISNFYHDVLSSVFNTGAVGSHPEQSKVLVTSLPFLLRQSIEIKVRRILGIDYWTINDRPDFHSFENSVKVLRKNHGLGLYEKFDLDVNFLSLIYDWSNVYVHGGYRTYPWLMESAIFHTKPLFSSGKLENERMRSFSLFGSVQVEKNRKEELMLFTKNHLEQLFNKDEVLIKWSISFDVWWI